jgi:hypothetical protein
MESGSLEAEDASSLPPASEGHTSDHDSTGDDSEKVASISEVQVVEVAPATSSSSVLSVPHIDIAASNAGVPADTAQPQNSHDDLKLKVANMPVLRLKVCPCACFTPLPLLHSAFSWITPVFFTSFVAHAVPCTLPFHPDAQDQEQPGRFFSLRPEARLSPQWCAIVCLEASDTASHPFSL